MLLEMPFGMFPEPSAEHREIKQSPFGKSLHDAVSVIGGEEAFMFDEMVCYLMHDGGLVEGAADEKYLSLFSLHDLEHTTQLLTDN
jgi:hypothetical protein